MLFIQNSVGNTCVAMECRDVGIKMEKWRMLIFMKNAQCPSTMTSNLNLCDHIYPHMGTGLSHIICSY